MLGFVLVMELVPQLVVKSDQVGVDSMETVLVHALDLVSG